MRVVFANGTSYQMNRPPRLEMLLEPVTLKFATLCTLLYVLLASPPEAVDGAFWIDASLWAVTLVFVVLSLGVVFWGLRFLARHGAISFVYTPVILVPLVILNAALGQGAITMITGNAMPQLAAIIPDVMRDICALVLFDILFGSFVASTHPYFAMASAEGSLGNMAAPLPERAGHDLPQSRESEPSRKAGPRAAVLARQTRSQARADFAQGGLDAGGLDAGDIGAAPASAMAPPAQGEEDAGFGSDDGEDIDAYVLNLNGEDVPRADIVCVRAQDHYVRVYTLQTVHVLRANFAEIVEEFGDEAGVQVSRSVWVSFEHVSLVWRTDAARYRVVLISGEEIQVASSRNIRVVDAMRQRGIPVVQSRSRPEGDDPAGQPAADVPLIYGRAS